MALGSLFIAGGIVNLHIPFVKEIVIFSKHDKGDHAT